MSTETDIIISGHLCLDLLPNMASVPQAALASPGKLFEVGALSVATGGSVSNTGLALERLGARVRLLANIGDDLIGGMIADVLRARNPQLVGHLRVQPNQSSSYSMLLSPENADRIVLHCTGTNATFGAQDIDYDAVGAARMFHLGYPPLLPRLIADGGAELTQIYQRIKAGGTVTSLDMALPDPNEPAGKVDWRRILQNTLPYVDVFVPSIEEILFMLRRADYDAWQPNVMPHLSRDYLHALADELLSYGAVIVGFKLGALGFYLRSSPDASAFARLARLSLDVPAWTGGEWYHPAFAVQVAGTTGAGDAAYAALLMALLRGSPPAEAVRWACAVGACNVEIADATSGVRTWDATAARMAAGWALRPERLSGFETD